MYIKSQTYLAINGPEVKNFPSIYLNGNIYHHEVPTKLEEKRDNLLQRRKKKLELSIHKYVRLRFKPLLKLA